MKKKNLVILALGAACLMAACTTPTQSSTLPGESTSGTPIPGSSNGGISESSKPATTYAIIDRTGDGVTVTLDKTKAAKGETVTATVAVSEGYILESLFANGSACTKVNDATYTFVMPDESVVLTSRLTVTGEAIITGDIAARLDKQGDGTFKGTITANVSSKIAVKVGGVVYAYGAVNMDRSFGDIGDASNDGFRVSGNAVYEVTFDVSLGQQPIVIKRTGFVHAPQSDVDLASAFNGDYAGRNVNDGGTYNINNLKKATYRNSRSGIQYEWNRYAGDVSIAHATNPLTEEDYVVYKKLTATNYRVVDTYVEAGKDNSGIWFDDTKREDTTKYSADYAVVENVTDKNYQVDAFNAKRDLITPSHDMHSVDRDMHYGYRTGFSVEDDVKAVSRVFTGVENGDGTYTTTVKSWKNFQNSNSVRSRSSYEISVTFNADSTVKSGSYKEYYFTESNWRFDDNDADNGGSAIEGKSGTLIQSSSYSYEYGDEYAAAPAFDETPYFISTITTLDVTSSGLEANNIQQNDIVDDWRSPQRESDESSSYGYSSLVHMTFEPSTALNRWQFGVVSSSDERVVGPRVNGSYGYQALRTGTSTLTVSGRTASTPSKTANVTVVNDIKPKNYYFMAAAGYDDDFIDASTVQVTAGSSTAVRLVIQPVNANYNPTITVSNPNVKVTLENDYDTERDAYYTAKILHIDATAMTNTATENVTLYVADEFDPTYRTEANFKVELTVKVAARPAAGLWPSTLAGTTWTSSRTLTPADNNYQDATIAFTDEDIEIGTATYKKAILNVTSGSEPISNYEMGYTYDASKPSLSFVGTKRSGWDYAYTPSAINASSGTFDFALSYAVNNWTSHESEYADVVGAYVDPAEEEEYGYETVLVTFTRNA